MKLPEKQPKQLRVVVPGDRDSGVGEKWGKTLLFFIRSLAVSFGFLNYVHILL